MILKTIEILLTIAALVGALTMVIAMGAYVAFILGMRHFDDLEDWTEEDNSC